MSSQTLNKTKAKRLSPDERRNQLLDCAQAIVIKRGLSTLTMDLLAKEAGVSNPLIYKYFATRMDLLQALLNREFHSYNSLIRERLQHVTDYREIVRVFVASNFDQFEEGNIMTILLAQADVRQAVNDSQSHKAGVFLVKELLKQFPINKAQAELLVVVGSSASIAAAERFSQVGGDRKEMIEQTVSFIIGGIESLATNPLKKES